MLKIRVALLGVLALLITSGALASTASALLPSWKVNGMKLGAQVKKQIKLTSNSATLKGKIVSTSASITCTSIKNEGAYIEGGGSLSGQGGATAIVFTNCTTTFPKCKVVEPIVTAQIKAHLITYGTGQQKIGELFEPSQPQKEEFASFTLENETPTEKCAVNGTPFPVKGTVAGEVITLGQKQEQQPLESVLGALILPAQPITKVKLEGQEKTVGLSIGANPGAVFSSSFGAQLVAEKQNLIEFGVYFA